MNVLFAADHSALTDATAALLMRMPLPHNSKLRILNVVSLPHMPGAVGMHPAWPRILDSLQQEAHSLNDTVAKNFRDFGRDVESNVRRGQSGDEILTEAERMSADLIVLGAVGRSAIERVTLGSVSDRVATHARCSTLVVRPERETKLADRPLRLLVAHDGSEQSRAAVQEVASLDWPADTEFKLVHVMERVDAFRHDIAQTLSAAWAAEQQQAERDLSIAAERLAENGCEVSTEVRVSAHAGESICQCAAAEPSDIIVLGDRGHGVVTRFVLGSISRYVLRHAICSVWISRKRS